MYARLFWLLPLVCFGAPFADAENSDSQPVPEYIFWMGADTPGRNEYQMAVADAALRRSTEKFGGYKLISDTTHLPAVRSRRVLAEGKRFHFVATTFSASENALGVIVVREPIQFGLLGTRQLLVQTQHLAKFQDISRQELAKLVAGQGRGWPEIGIYQANNFSVEGFSEFFHLFPNLLAGRIDYVPLGIEEIEPTMARYGEKYSGISVVPNLLIKYPLPVYLVVSANQPELAKRLKWGLAKLREEGELRDLFNRHKSEYLEIVNAADVRIFELANPDLIPSE
ncbi:hypothetical protein QWI17_02285 [Gilvimarinus sp. SDUM040013]|uniref:Solute-binding protein family 3/N-terminal domain-containing protein n=1 Tax=Gilvimarinus gilvus TaxID=3058038 RepID=A0ABU4RZE8_9GAMM|nr:hypothetical protein [Gilvimarinus sp. SDUM040013]MDO3384660.1 hypothetical protein [Gilvimarinus sp. SDUM040013]MDX6850246.1 hypothetical protein [Gilvimarinus sp. SDUM040013]